MTRSTGERELPKAYLRMDPDIDQKHPDNGWNFIRLLCAANRQRPRGYFACRGALETIFGRPLVRTFYSRGDVMDAPGGKVYVCGWGVWQEGDLTVAERVSRIRGKRDNVTPAVTPGEDPPSLPSRYSAVTQPLLSRYPTSTVSSTTPNVLLSETEDGRPKTGDRTPEPAIEAYGKYFPSFSRDALAFLDELIAEYGQEWTARAIGEAGTKGRDRLLSRAKTILLLWNRDRDKAEAAAERAKVAAQRAPVVLQAVKAEPITPEEEERQIAEYKAAHNG